MLDKKYRKKQVKNCTIKARMFDMFAPVEDVWFEEVATNCNKNIAMQSLKKTLKQKEVTGELYNKIMSKVAYILDNNKKDRIYEFVNIFCPETGCTYVVDVEQTCKRLRKATSLDKRRNERGEYIYDKRRKQQLKVILKDFFGDLFEVDYDVLSQLLDEEIHLAINAGTFDFDNSVFNINEDVSVKVNLKKTIAIGKYIVEVDSITYKGKKIDNDFADYFRFISVVNEDVYDLINNRDNFFFSDERELLEAIADVVEKIDSKYEDCSLVKIIDLCVECALENDYEPPEELIAIIRDNLKIYNAATTGLLVRRSLRY
jgi:hypothetical protein